MTDEEILKSSFFEDKLSSGMRGVNSIRFLDSVVKTKI